MQVEQGGDPPLASFTDSLCCDTSRSPPKPSSTELFIKFIFDLDTHVIIEEWCLIFSLTDSASEDADHFKSQG